MTCLVHLYSYLRGNNRLQKSKGLYSLYRYRIKNWFGVKIINWKIYGRRGKPGGHQERVVKNGSLLGKLGGLAGMGLRMRPAVYFQYIFDSKITQSAES